MRKIERLQLALAPRRPRHEPHRGGVPVADLSQGYLEADWEMALGDIFWES